MTTRYPFRVWRILKRRFTRGAREFRKETSPSAHGTEGKQRFCPSLPKRANRDAPDDCWLSHRKSTSTQRWVSSCSATRRVDRRN